MTPAFAPPASRSSPATIPTSRIKMPPTLPESAAWLASRDMDEVRIDKWLWAARFFKTRGAATEAVTGGRVLLNGVRIKPAKEVRPGDMVEVRVGQTTWTIRVVAIAEKRGSASVAAGLYEETPESVVLREQRVQQRRLATPPGADLGARPTKRDRRRLDALRKAMRDRRGA